MRQYTERTDVEGLEKRVPLGLKNQPTCLVSAARIEQCLKGLGDPMREKWRGDFCRAQGLTAEPVSRGVLFSRGTAPDAEGAEISAA